MSSTNAPYGLLPVRHPSGTIRPQGFNNGILSGYNTAIYQYQPVKMSTDGYIQAASAGDQILGSFAGVQYVDANGRPNYSNQWLASTSASQIVAYVTTDPQIVYAIQADGSLTQAAIGDEADVSNASATNGLGFSAATLSTSLVGANNTATLRVVDLYNVPDNAWGDAYTQVLVQVVEHQYVAPKAAI